MTIADNILLLSMNVI